MKAKKPKLTPEEKAEIRIIKKQWNQFIIKMKKKGALIEEAYPGNSSPLFLS